MLCDKVVHSLSCSSAKVLGKKAVEMHGTLTFIGYDSPFVVLNDDYSASRPFDDEIAKPFMESSMRVSECLIKGNTTGESFKKSQDMYNSWIRHFWARGEIKDSSDIILYLMLDRDSQVIIGDKNIHFTN
jgi:hypothetical protein